MRHPRDYAEAVYWGSDEPLGLPPIYEDDAPQGTAVATILTIVLLSIVAVIALAGLAVLFQ